MPRRRFGSFVVAVRLVFGACDGPAAGVAGAALVGFALSRTVGCFGFVEGGVQPAPRALLSVLTGVAILALVAVAIVD